MVDSCNKPLFQLDLMTFPLASPGSDRQGAIQRKKRGADRFSPLTLWCLVMQYISGVYAGFFLVLNINTSNKNYCKTKMQCLYLMMTLNSSKWHEFKSAGSDFFHLEHDSEKFALLDVRAAEKNYSLLLFCFAFFLTANGTYLDMLPLSMPRRRTKIRRNVVGLFFSATLKHHFLEVRSKC